MASQSSSNLTASWENIAWEQGYPSQMSHSGQSWVARPYRAAIPANLAHARWQVSCEVAAETEEATVAIARFQSHVVAEFALLAATLMCGEAWLSSRIEGVTASARKIAEAGLTQPTDFGVRTSNAELIVVNVRAMDAALQLAERVDQAAILSMHRALLQDSAPDIAGKWRDDQVWIGGQGRLGALSPHTADFVPPTHVRVPDALADLVHFAQRQDLPALAQTAITHAQFETIHPFADGNGRTGRALIHAMFRAKGLTNHVSVPLSSGLLTARDNYFEALTHYRGGEIDPIVSEVARAALVGVARGRALVADLGQVRDQ